MASYNPLLIIGSGLALLVVFDIAIKYRKALKAVRYLPGRRELLGIGFPRHVLPTIPGIVISRHDVLDDGHSIYTKFGSGIISWIEMIPTIRAHVFVADAVAIKEMSSNRSRFVKNLTEYISLLHFGPNIVTSPDGDEWRRQRKIVAPSFNEKNNKLVWNEMIRLGFEIFESWGQDNATAYVNDSVSELTLPLTLGIISSAGFGRPTSWLTSTETEIPAGHTMTFKNALHYASTNIIKLAHLPKWAVNFSKTLKRGKEATDNLTQYLIEMIEDKKTGIGMEEQNDLFSAMLAVNMANDSKESPSEKLSQAELLGNMFIFILAGHETTAHTLTFVLGLLAIHQDEQEKLYQHVSSVIPGQEIPAYESYGQLTYLQAVIYETMRVFPPVVEIPKEVHEDTLLPYAGQDGTIKQAFIEANVEVRIDVVGLHYNPRYWPDPLTFNPSRFLGDYNRDAFTPFSIGARACIGRRFAETEMIAFLALLMKFYRVELKDKASYEGLSKVEQRMKLFPTLQMITTTPKNPVPLVFRKRSTIKA